MAPYSETTSLNWAIPYLATGLPLVTIYCDERRPHTKLPRPTSYKTTLNKNYVKAVHMNLKNGNLKYFSPPTTWSVVSFSIMNNIWGKWVYTVTEPWEILGYRV